mmetsp:Transcript_2671/g.3863  ORF Transcript_2671/g.3863 Transcript_2671/m.3863 type:complete len:474 (+) Transcript_2671:106-1527(+)
MPLVTDDNFQKDVKNLVKWLKKSGAAFPKVEISRYAKEGRDLRSKEKIKAGEQIIYIPRRCILDVNQGKDCKIGRAVKCEAKGWISGHTYLAIRMLTERDLGESSFFAPWFKVLPKEYKSQGMPQYWTEDQKKELKGTKTLAKTNAVKAAIKEMWGRVSQVAAVQKAGWTLEDFAWARYTVLTRTFGVDMQGKEATIMVPMADMANHEFDRPSRWKYDDKKKGFVVKVIRDLDIGANLTDTYGSKGNDSFLPFYGFCLENNEFNQGRFVLPVKNVNGVEVDFLRRIAVSRCAYELEDGKVKKIDATTDTEGIGSKRGGKELFTYCRALALTSDEYERIRKNKKNIKRPTEIPISRSNEKRALKIIKNSAQRALSMFPTTIEEDEAILQDYVKAPRFSWFRNAVLARLGEKQTLTHYIRLSEMVAPLMSCSSLKKLEAHKNFQDIRVADRQKEWGYYANKYIDRVVIPLVKGRK